MGGPLGQIKVPVPRPFNDTNVKSTAKSGKHKLLQYVFLLSTTRGRVC